MSRLSDSQKWVIVAFLASILVLATTYFLQDNLRVFAYVLIGMGVALYAVLTNGGEKRNSGS